VIFPQRIRAVLYWCILKKGNIKNLLNPLSLLRRARYFLVL
jgi:hypothetical protein